LSVVITSVQITTKCCSYPKFAQA